MTRRELLAASVPFSLPATRALSDFEHRIFDQINELRESWNAPKLAWSGYLAALAREQCARKAELHFPGHEDPERGGIDQRLAMAGINWARCGENMFSERGYDDPVNYAIVFWWYSKGHRENMLNPLYAQSGIGIFHADDGTFFVTQIFLTV